MCGVCGVRAPGGIEASELDRHVAGMNQRLHHRGPDGNGQHRSATTGLAMSRLAIIDVAGSEQPMQSVDRSLVVVFNGEIYNYIELRAQLQQLGHEFRTRGDTEVILHGYRQWGEELPNHLQGMFAFCIHDRTIDKLVLARDRFGEKPLFYHWNNSHFSFSSELASLLEDPNVPRRINLEAIGYYLRLSFVPEPLTALLDVWSLPAGHVLTLHNNELKVVRYFRLAYREDPNLADVDTAKAAVVTALDNAVARQARADVDIGCALSGGIDSSAVAASLQRNASRPVHTFTVRFADSSYDESDMARATAGHIGSNHHEIDVPRAGFSIGLVETIIDHVGQPFADSSAIPMYALSRAVRNHVKVLLSGDGGDEMFCGYRPFSWLTTIEKIARMPKPLLQGGSEAVRLASHFPGADKMSTLRQARKALEIAQLAPHLRPVAMHSIFSPLEVQKLLPADTIQRLVANGWPVVTRRHNDSEDSPLRQLMRYRVEVNLPSDMLTKVDRMAMAASLEVRAPLLDLEIAELAAKIPESLLLHRGQRKYILREAVRDRLPPELFSRPKSGFSVPLRVFMNDEFFAFARSEFNALKSEKRLPFDHSELENILRRGQSQTKDRAEASVYRTAHQLWSTVMLAAWARRFDLYA